MSEPRPDDEYAPGDKCPCGGALAPCPTCGDEWCAICEEGECHDPYDLSGEGHALSTPGAAPPTRFTSPDGCGGQREPCDRGCGFDTAAGHQPCAPCQAIEDQSGDPLAPALRELQSARSAVVRRLAQLDAAIVAVRSARAVDAPRPGRPSNPGSTTIKSAVIATMGRGGDWTAGELAFYIEDHMPMGTNPVSSVRTVLSRLTSSGVTERVSHGIYRLAAACGQPSSDTSVIGRSQDLDSAASNP